MRLRCCSVRRGDFSVDAVAGVVGGGLSGVVRAVAAGVLAVLRSAGGAGGGAGGILRSDGGGTMSARYLAPVLPLLAVPLALGVERLRRVGWGLLAVSVGLSLSAAALGLALQRHQQGIRGGVFWPAWAGGNFNSNLGAAVGLQRYWVLAPLLVVWVVVGGWLVWVVAGKS